MAGLLRGVACWGAVACSALAFAASGTAAPSQLGMSFLDDGVVRVGVNLDDGAKLAYLATSSGEEASGAQNLLFEVEPSADPEAAYCAAARAVA